MYGVANCRTPEIFWRNCAFYDKIMNLVNSLNMSPGIYLEIGSSQIFYIRQNRSSKVPLRGDILKCVE